MQQVVCLRCHRVLEFSGDRPSFCGYCGQPLPASAPDATAEYADETSTLAPGVGATPVPGAPPAVGGYRLLRPLGSGGMGTVYEAEDTATGRRVALKLIAPEFAAAREAVERFRQEGRLASAIAHPRCVFVLAADEDAGRPYIVMELMPGETLHDLVRKHGPLPPRRAVAKILDVIEGLQEAHRLGVVHRDVKPSNCFLEPNGRVKVGDFGLSKSLVSDAQLTRTGTFLGTPLYASPEQIRREAVDQQSDVYSVAATLYYLLTGRAPFETNDAAAALARIAADPAPSMRTLRPDLPPDLDQVVLRGLEKDRERRWRNLEEFKTALLPFVRRDLVLSGVLALRFGAYLLDLFLYVVTFWVVFLAVSLADPDIIQMFWDPVYAIAPSWYQALGLLITLMYFAIPEGLWGRTPGKWLLSLRVTRASGTDPPGLGRALVRVGVFELLINLGAFASWIIQVVVWPDGMSPEELQLYSMFSGAFSLGGMLLGVGIMCLTMRARNGYRGLHEWASGTRTLQVVSPAQRLYVRAPARPLGLSRSDDLPQRLGPFVIEGAYPRTAAGTILVGEDANLSRKAWLWLRPADEPPVPAARRELSRLTRLRWLSSGRAGEQQWDAFLAPAGCSLPELVANEGRLTWPQARPILEQVTEELTAACADGTLPPVLSAEQVWVQPDGRVYLLDMPLGGTAALPNVKADQPPEQLTARPADGGASAVLEAQPADAADQERALGLLREVAVLALEGGLRPPADEGRPVRAPLPGYARQFLDRLFGTEQPAIIEVRELRDELARTRNFPLEVSRGRRGAHVAVLSAFLLFSLGCCVLPVSVTPGSWATMFIHTQALDQENDLRALEAGALCDYLSGSLHLDPLVRARAAVQYARDQGLRAQLQARLDETRREHADRLAAMSWLAREFVLTVEQSMEQHHLQQPQPTWFKPGDFRRQAEWAARRDRVDWRDSSRTRFVMLGFWPAVWVLTAFVLRGGLTFPMVGLALVRSDGRKAGRFRCAWRALLVWAPVTALLAASAWLDIWYWSMWPHARDVAWVTWVSLVCWWGAVALLVAYAALAVLFPARTLHDWLSGTSLVPR